MNVGLSIIKDKEEVASLAIINTFTQETGLKGTDMVKEHTAGQKELNTLDHGRMDKNMVKE